MKKIQDVQGRSDSRNLDIKRVGITGVAYRGFLDYEKQSVPVQGTADCFAFLDKSKKGTHMSRMARHIAQLIDQKITYSLLKKISLSLYKALETNSIYIDLHTKAIRAKESPVSKNVGFEEFEIHFLLEVENGDFDGTVRIDFIGTSLCPASKTNSKYGAHNQRSLVTIKFPIKNVRKISKYLEISENQLSAKVYPIIKLDDEALITQQAYENAKFVEDIVRDVASGLKKNNLEYTKVTCENFESIHTHNAYAEIVE